METPEIHALTRIRWDFFGTLTFKSSRLPESIRRAMWITYLRIVGKNFRVPFHSLLWALRRETGEQFGRVHFHFLLGWSGHRTAVNKSTCFWLMKTWERIGGGHARVRVYDPTLDAGSYLTKSLGISPADSFESAKFGAVNSELTLSHSIAEVHRWDAMRQTALRLGRHPKGSEQLASA